MKTFSIEHSPWLLEASADEARMKASRDILGDIQGASLASAGPRIA